MRDENAVESPADAEVETPAQVRAQALAGDD
jgi:hypothetical protein